MNVNVFLENKKPPPVTARGEVVALSKGLDLNGASEKKHEPRFFSVCIGED